MEDVDTIVSFSAAMAMETEGRQLDRERLRRGTVTFLNSPGYGFFQVAEATAEGRIIGQLMVTYEWSDWRDGVFWWIQSVYVDPAWRRQGVFRRLHGAILARTQGDPAVCGIRLYVDETNHIAQTAYRRVGLTPSPYVVFEQDFLYPRRPVLQDRPDEA
jgi:GNAT superfamily N-acetyltransferase